MEDKVLYRRPRYQRAQKTPGLRFQSRDGEILQALRLYDGVLARRHLKEMFWPTAASRTMAERLSLLYHQAYLDWPNDEQRRTKPIPESIVWLGWKGALWLAGRDGLFVDPPANGRENQLRSLQRSLRERTFRWVREPRWSQLAHDLAVIDFRLAVEQAVSALASITLETWITEGEFLSDTDVIQYQIEARNGQVRRQKKGVCPDGYFVLVDQDRLVQGTPARARFLLEADMATHDNPSFAGEKAAAGAAYIRSLAYKSRFGYNSGRWLVVTTGTVRRDHLMHQTQKTLGPDARVFLFSTLGQVSAPTVLTTPIWRVPGRSEPVALFGAAGDA